MKIVHILILHSIFIVYVFATIRIHSPELFKDQYKCTLSLNWISQGNKAQLCKFWKNSIWFYSGNSLTLFLGWKSLLLPRELHLLHQK